MEKAFTYRFSPKSCTEVYKNRAFEFLKLAVKETFSKLKLSCGSVISGSIGKEKSDVDND